MNWHKKSVERLTPSQRFADWMADAMGSWGFMILQTIFLALWVALNVTGAVFHWDGYPFVLLNLVLAVQAAYAAPLIMMSQNRQETRDRQQAEADYQTNLEAKAEIEELQRRLSRIENDKLDEILRLLKSRS